MCVQLRSTNNYGLKHTHTHIYIYYIISYVTNSALPSTTETSPNIKTTNCMFALEFGLDCHFNIEGTHRSGSCWACSIHWVFLKAWRLLKLMEFLLKSWVKEHQHQKAIFFFHPEFLIKQFRIKTLLKTPGQARLVVPPLHPHLPWGDLRHLRNSQSSHRPEIRRAACRACSSHCSPWPGRRRFWGPVVLDELYDGVFLWHMDMNI